MTHTTDEELDALVNRAGDAPLDDKDNCFICYESGIAITTLRAQLAEARAERDAVVAVRDMLGNRWATEKDRADRAEAAMAALESAHHVNKMPKSEHDSADVLTTLEPAPVTLADALKVPEVEALISLIPEVIASLDATRCNVSLTSELCAALRAVGRDEANG